MTTKLKLYELITIKLNKASNSFSLVTWTNKEEFNDDNISMIISASINYINITKINYRDNKYYYYINLND